MDSIKTIRPRNYLYEFLVALNGLVLIVIWWLILRSVRGSILAGCLSYLILAWSLRLAFQKYHRKGMKLMRAKNFSDAASAFHNSYMFFKNHPNIDRYRFITMFTSSAIPYQQMALNNMGICYLQMGDAARALDSFEKLAALNSNYPYIDRTIEEIRKHMKESS